MKYLLGIFILVCFLQCDSLSASEDLHNPDHPPVGTYIVRIWDIPNRFLNEPTWTGHVILRKDAHDTYTGDWVEYDDHFSAFYSEATKLLTGAWYSTNDHLWGAINFHWDGRLLSGRWTWFGRNGTGYEIWVPAPTDYIIPVAISPAAAPSDHLG